MGNYLRLAGAFGSFEASGVLASLVTGFAGFLPKIRSKLSPYFFEKPELTCLWAKSEENRDVERLNIIAGFKYFGVDFSGFGTMNRLMEFTTRPAVALMGLGIQTRGVYFARARWFPWRQKIAHRWQRQAMHDRHLLPREVDSKKKPIMTSKPRRDASELGALYHYQVKEVPLSLRRLHEYVRLLKNRNLQDAIDWIACLSRPSSRPILQMLKRAKYELVEKRGLDLGRLSIDHSHSDRGEYVKIVRRMRVGHYSMFRSPRHHFRVYVREMPVEEYFHRMYILGKVPQCVSFDMRQALRDQRVAPETARAWAPYLTSNSRYRHRRELRRLNSIGQFDYYKARDRWIRNYQNNLVRLKDTERLNRNGGSSIEQISE